MKSVIIHAARSLTHAAKRRVNKYTARKKHLGGKIVCKKRGRSGKDHGGQARAPSDGLHVQFLTLDVVTLQGRKREQNKQEADRQQERQLVQQRE